MDKDPQCPKCGRPIEIGEITWPVALQDGSIGEACQDCWEDICADAWWKVVAPASLEHGESGE